MPPLATSLHSLLLLLLLLLTFSLPTFAFPTARSISKPLSLSGPPSTLGSGTYPRATRLSSSTLLAVYTSFSNNNNILTVTKSTNNGQTWTPLGTITQGPSSTTDIDNAYILSLPSGRLLAAFRNHDKDATTHAYTYFRITICYSDDGGKTWGYLSTPAQDPGPVNGNWEPLLRNAADGSLQLYYSRENSAKDQDTLERFSTDGGVTWSAPLTISGAGVMSRDGMTGVATVSGKNLIAVFETETTGIFSISSITSADDGKTWSTARRTVYTATGTSNSAGAPQVLNVGGTLVVSVMTSEDSNLGTSGGAYTGHTEAKVLRSTDGGVSWGAKITVFVEQTAWPGLVGLDAGSFLVLADHGGVKGQKVVVG